MAGGVHELVVDLSGSWDGARLLPTLARTHTVLAERGGMLRLLGLALPEFLAALRTASLDEVFLIYDTVRRDATAGVPEPSRTEEPTPERRGPDATAARFHV